MIEHAVALRQDTLSHHARRLPVPSYDRASLAPGVVHLSVGCFHRSHQAVYFDALAERGSVDWGIVGVSHRNQALRGVLRAQDGLYTVIERGPDGDAPRVVGAICRYLHAPDSPDAVVTALADARTRLVTLTVTGAGYRPDLTDARRPAPQTVLGQIVAALARRRRAGDGPFTVLSCDNLVANGAIARRGVLELARLRDPALARWIEDRVTFPCSLVDRITPRTTDADRAGLAAEFGVDDRWPVVTEPFSQWVVEDAFCAGRPPLDEVGVRFVADVRPYALIKTRLLNAVHCALGYLGTLAGHATTDAAMEAPALAAYVRSLLAEVRPLLPRVLGMDLGAYERDLLARVANHRLADQLPRLCRSGSTKVPHHLVASIADARARNRPHPALTLAVAAWCRYLRGTDDDGRHITVDDPAAARLQRLARNPRALLAEADLFGTLGDDEAFVREFELCLRRLEREGVHGTLTEDPGAASVPA